MRVWVRELAVAMAVGVLIGGGPAVHAAPNDAEIAHAETAHAETAHAGPSRETARAPAPAPAAAATPAPAGFESADAVLRWMAGYRGRPEPTRLPAAIATLSAAGALAIPERAGLPVGFLAGVIAAQPTRADKLVTALDRLPPRDSWVIVRAIAYSGHPDWKGLLARTAARLPAQRAAIEGYVQDRLPVLDRLAMDDPPSGWSRLRAWLPFAAEAVSPPALEVRPEVLDTLWGVYFATGDAAPLRRIVALLPWWRERDDLRRLTVGCMARFTLVANATRDPALLALLREEATRQPAAGAADLRDALAAAESDDLARVRTESLAAIQALERKTRDRNPPDRSKTLEPSPAGDRPAAALRRPRAEPDTFTAAAGAPVDR
ncbi:hypothetical protein GJ689_01395 [Rhodoplanes serenus]|uniref:HEAT repeat domain-containing protein n=1 Tax=Rhodoplanes serenus TaxID=200615 RepID=A0A9X4XGV1_9BRAD|nr:hypothetical protein [Rhodoplanes serenus]MTW14873.1 hypothetical protein [Rhodoplanes serenus]